MPIIFASSLLMIPGVGFGLLAGAFETGGTMFKALNLLSLTMQDQARTSSTCSTSR